MEFDHEERELGMEQQKSWKTGSQRPVMPPPRPMMPGQPAPPPRPMMPGQPAPPPRPMMPGQPMPPNHPMLPPNHPMMPPQQMPRQLSFQPLPWDQRRMPNQPMPYYMTYEDPLLMQEQDDDKDIERLMSMYPKSARKIQMVIEVECDKMEYDGSLMFDEYPDKERMERIIDSIYQQIEPQQEDAEEDAAGEESVFATQCKRCQPDSVRDLISVMLFEEMHRRRCRRRRCRRWW